MDVLHFFLKEIPKITLLLITLPIIFISLCCWFELLIPSYLHFSLSLTFRQHQLWRLLTPFFSFGNFNQSFFLHITLLLRNAKQLERSVFKGNAADFLYCLLIMMMMLLVANVFIGFPFMSYSLCFAITYYWAKMNRRTIVKFLGIIDMNAPFLPWFYVGMAYLIGAEYKEDLCGIAVGHLYFYMKEIMPRMGLEGKIMKTPLRIIRLCEQLDLNNEFYIEMERNNQEDWDGNEMLF